MKFIECVVIAGEFRRLEGGAGVGQEGPVAEGDSEGSAHCADVLHHPFDVPCGVEFRQEPAFRGRVGMDFHADPFNREVELLLELFDDAFADVAEGSDVIGEHLYADCHGITPSHARSIRTPTPLSVT